MHLCVFLYGFQLRVVRSASEDAAALVEPILGFIKKKDLFNFRSAQLWMYFKNVNVVLIRSNHSEMSFLEDRGRKAASAFYLYVLWALLGHVTGKQRKRSRCVWLMTDWLLGAGSHWSPVKPDTKYPWQQTQLPCTHTSDWVVGNHICHQ